ncbi:head GIN domain-containing protein [Hymenobacter sp. BT730]|uniref:head GIN domain-containing protein n=1 Tax=Hymenobacter sp. BT730 TaxID=3063332 RepID=UPI0026DF11BA|nr:head GIN domain-containing protein [Hymenobacter sp. BT730]
MLLSGCKPDHELDCFKSTGKVITTRRELPPIHTLTVFDNVDVNLVQDTATFAEVRTGKNLQQDLELTEQDGSLTIRNTSRCNWVRRYDVPREVTVHLPSLLNLFQKGQNTVRTQGTFRTEKLFCHLVGAGDFDLNVDTRYLWLDLYELGDIRVTGRTDTLHLTLGGLGSVYGRDLNARRSVVQINRATAGNAHLQVTQELYGTHAGAGTLFYSGHPASVAVSVTGKGKLMPVE